MKLVNNPKINDFCPFPPDLPYTQANKLRSSHFIAFPNQMRYIIAPSPQAMRGLGVGFFYLTEPRTAISIFWVNYSLLGIEPLISAILIIKSDGCNYYFANSNYQNSQYHYLLILSQNSIYYNLILAI